MRGPRGSGPLLCFPLSLRPSPSVDPVGWAGAASIHDGAFLPGCGARSGWPGASGYSGVAVPDPLGAAREGREGKAGVLPHAGCDYSPLVFGGCFEPFGD